MRPAVSRCTVRHFRMRARGVTSGNFRNRNRVARMIDEIAQKVRDRRGSSKARNLRRERSTAAMLSLILLDRRISRVYLANMENIYICVLDKFCERNHCSDSILKYSKNMSFVCGKRICIKMRLLCGVWKILFNIFRLLSHSIIHKKT